MSPSVLSLCDEYGLHIKEYRGDESFKPCYYCTHYIMRGEKILVSLNLSEVERWVMSKCIQAKRVEQMLISEGLDLEDSEKCEISLSETVSPRKNIDIYRMLIK